MKVWFTQLELGGGPQPFSCDSCADASPLALNKTPQGRWNLAWSRLCVAFS